MHSRGAGRDDIGVEHHVGQPPVAVERVAIVEGDDGLALDGGEPVVAGNASILLIRVAVSLLPVVVFPALDAEPGDELVSGELRLGGPFGREIDDGVPNVGLHPRRAVQGSSSAHFNLMCSSASRVAFGWE
ncbi:MAG: hypothetical protein IPN01_25530 [Deltaproteobacteria bacterium]|nr:hypothetical protein [Deltaproteobacteria bacterium]